MGFYSGKKILVTGGTGMIGKPLVDLLIKEGAIVRIASLDDPSRANPQAEFIKADLTDFQTCMNICKDMEIVFSLVGIKGSPKMMKERPASYFVPSLFFNTNMMEAARKCNVQRYLYTSSIGVYAPAETFNEDDVQKNLPSPNDLFGGWHKRTAELQAEAYKIEYGWDKISIVRPANVYGPHDNFDPENAMVIPALIHRAISGENPLKVKGDGNSIRDFIFSEDVARGMMLVVEKGYNLPVNLGSGTKFSVRDIVNMIVSNLEKKPVIEYEPSKSLGGDKVRVMNIERAESIGFRPQTSLEEGIKKTIGWYKDNKETADKRFNVFTIKRKRVLICGATGFLGRNIAESLANRHDLEIFGTYFNSEPLKNPRIKMIKADLRDPEIVKEVVKNKDVIIQMAAITSGAKDIKSIPHIHVTDNALMNSLIFRAAHDNKIPHVIFPSCSIMYSSQEEPLKEEDFDISKGIPEKYFGAGWTKVYLEKMCEFFSKRGETKYTVIRHSNVYGPYDKFDLEKSHVFGATMTKIMTAADGGKITVWGDGKEDKDLIYIDDFVDFINIALDRQTSKFELLNIGYGKPISIREIVSKIIEKSGKKIDVEYDLSHLSKYTKIVLDYRKANNLFGWKPKTSIEEGINKTIEWYKNNLLIINNP
ncbi:MAG: NAD(P)-dependent oxidoreductase [Nanoarchaeota archaeon]|nr:NAD(P)-dependent oxidoreductase [Nanoarchaeota archaeon]